MLNMELQAEVDRLKDLVSHQAAALERILDKKNS